MSAMARSWAGFAVWCGAFVAALATSGATGYAAVGREVTVEVVVKWPDGRPAAGVDAWVEVWGLQEWAVRTDDQGACSVVLPNAWTRVLEVRAGEAGLSELVTVRPAAGESTVSVEVTVHPIPELTGRVTLPDGRPAANLSLVGIGGLWRECVALAAARRVTSFRGIENLSSGDRLVITTDGEGRYRVPLLRKERLRGVRIGAPPDTAGDGAAYRIYLLSAQGVGCAGPLQIPVQAGTREQRLDIRLQKGDQASGRVVGYPGGKGLPGARVRAVIEGGDPIGGPVVWAEAVSDEQGRFAITASLPAGAYEIGADAGAGWGYAGLSGGGARPEPGARELELQMVRDADLPLRFLAPDGKPLARREIHLHIAGGQQWAQAMRADDDGRVLLPVRARRMAKQHWPAASRRLQVEAAVPELGLTGYLEVDLTQEWTDSAEARMKRALTVIGKADKKKVEAAQTSGPVALPGRLLITKRNAPAVVVSQRSDNHQPIGLTLDQGDLSPSGEEVVWGVGGDGYPVSTHHLWKSSVNGGEPLNLTEKLGGVNCAPAWSPDGSMIAFQRAAPEEGQEPCQAGFQVWVMQADGSQARQVSQPPAHESDWTPRWTSDGLRLVCESFDGFASISHIGADRKLLSDITGQGDLSPDGTRLALATYAFDTVAGAAGVWRRLVLVDLRNGNRRVLVQQFVSDAEAKAHVEKRHLTLSDPQTITTVTGPGCPAWSPDGEQIAFVAALPFDPEGPEYRKQAEVWIYHLATDELTRVTDDQEQETWLRWR